MNHESDIINAMIEKAQRHNLLGEVIYSFVLNCRNYRPLELEEWQDCADEALNEWIK